MSLIPLEVSIITKSLKQVKTTVFHIPPNVENGPLLVFLPGNPGFINYYMTYLSTIHTNLPQIEVVGISHAGFSSLHGPDEHVYSLEDQIEHKVNVIKHYIGANHDREVLIFGHSVGCYILQRVTDSLRAKYKMIGMITPTVVDIHKSKKGSYLAAMTSTFESFYYYSGFAGYLMKAIPTSLRSFIIGFVLKNSSVETQDTTQLLVTETGFIRQALGLGTEEMKTIRGDWQYQEHWFSRKGIWAFFAEGDHWVNDDTRSRLIKVIKESDNETVIDISDEFTHSFCVLKSVEFAHVTSEKLRKFLIS